MADDRRTVRSALDRAGVRGTSDFGRFVNNTTHFRPSEFDAVAAAPTLLDLLPALSDPGVVAAVGRHLQGVQVRRYPGAYESVRTAYLEWAPLPGETGWVLGDTLCKASDKSRGPDLLYLAGRSDDGTSRQCIVESLWRFKNSVDVETSLRVLVTDRDVVLQAMSALQRTIGAEGMVGVLEELLSNTDDPKIRQAAERKLRTLRRKLGSAADD